MPEQALALGHLVSGISCHESSRHFTDEENALVMDWLIQRGFAGEELMPWAQSMKTKLVLPATTLISLKRGRLELTRVTVEDDKGTPYFLFPGYAGG